MIRRLRERTAGDAGFTMMEMLVALTIGLIICTAALTILDVTMRRTTEVGQRVDSDSRGRLLMDRLTRGLRSQICQTSEVPPVRSATKGLVGGHYQESVSYYADMTDGRNVANVPDLRTITFDGTDRTVTEDVTAGTKNALSGAITYGAPYIHRVIATDVAQDSGADVFSYFAFNSPTDGSAPTPSKQLVPPMAVGSVNSTVVARIAIRFRMLPRNKTTVTSTSTAFTDDVYVRAADPNDPAPIPTCV